MTRYLVHQMQQGSLLPQSGKGTVSDVARAPGTAEAQPLYRAGEYAGSLLDDRKLLEPVGNYAKAFNRPGLSMTTVGVPALLAALGLAGFNQMTGRSPVTGLLLGAGLGGLAGAGLHSLTRGSGPSSALLKASYYISDGQDPLIYIADRLQSASDLSGGLRQQMLQQVQSLSKSDQISLARLLRTVAGTAVGYVISRYLLRLGGVGTMLLSGLGGVLGSMAGQSQRNVYGQITDPMRDLFGQPR